MDGYIYLFQNKLNNKCYVGQTCDFERRLAEHIYEANKGSMFHLHQAIRKYGINNFDISVLYKCSGEEVVLDSLNEKEMYYIDKYDSFNSGYNMTAGSRGSLGLHHSEEARKKMSEARIGITLSDAHKQAISESNHRRDVTSDTRKKMSDNNAMLDKKNRDKISESYRKQTPEQIKERCRKMWETRRARGDVSEQQRRAAIKGHQTRNSKKMNGFNQTNMNVDGCIVQICGEDAIQE